jgi:hypothetical protein
VPCYLRGLDLSLTDYQTIRDITEMAHMKDYPTLEAALIALFAARHDGSLCVRADAESLARRLPEFPEREQFISRFLVNLHAGMYKGNGIGRIWCRRQKKRAGGESGSAMSTA